MSECELLLAAVKGDNEAFQRIYELGDKVIRNAVRKQLHNIPEAEDVVQNTWMRILRKAHSFRGDAKFSSWAYRIATNEAWLWYRRANQKSNSITKTDSLEALGTARDGSKRHWEPVAVELLHPALTVSLENALLQLRGRLREVLILRLKDMEYAEIATEMGISLGAVKSYMYRAIGLASRAMGVQGETRYDKWRDLQKRMTKARAAGL